VIAGRYSVEREVGRGGTGAVWLGRDEVLGRQVALKRIGLLPGADSTDLARAEREARLAARLNHPHVVAVFNVVFEADAQWLVMEYVDGTDLAQLVRDEGPLSPDEAGRLLGQAADALAEAHAEGIVHRDVKPSNILVDRRRRAKLTDFGIARIAADPALTQTGMVTGSPAYLAPEVATGERGTEAVDVWSLGATLFYVLAGRPPYDLGDHVLGGLYRIVNEEPPRLPDASWLAPVLEGTMVRDPAQRWSMAQVRDYLATPGGGAVPPPSTSVLPDPGADRTRTSQLVPAASSKPGSPPASRRLRVGGLVALAVAVVLGLVLFLVLSDREPPAGTAGPSPSSTASQTASTRSPTPSKSPTRAPTPTARGMESFVEGYVAALSTDIDSAWNMLTPKFQRESGGLSAYRKFWSGVGNGRILDISADPEDLVVSYRVRFDNFGTGRRPTVLQLVYEDGRYRIDGESTSS
jgi:serine/threonine protein kinase